MEKKEPLLIDSSLMDALSDEACHSSRRRKNLNFHFGGADLLQRMLNAFEPGTYVRPHKHGDPEKREVFLVLRGRLLMVFFDDEGNITEKQLLDQQQGNYGVEIPPGLWHAAVSLADGTIVYEVKDGPYDPETDKQFAPWAPEEGSPEADEYLQRLAGGY
ncbi:MAG: WbuC family cupin fold metalloprotein [Marinilabiliaceae bacterium]